LLIIFDLDDTLIQTSEVITPWRFQRVLKFLESKGHDNDLLESLYQEITKQHQRFETSSEALLFFFQKHQINQSFYPECLSILNDFTQDLPVSIYKGVIEMLKALKSEVRLACVTSGMTSNQELKLNKSGLKELFEEIIIVETGDKVHAYRTVFENSKKSCVLVVGDRIQKDLVPAKSLGFYTALVQQGRGLFQKINHQYVDFVIQDVLEVENLIKSIKKL